MNHLFTTSGQLESVGDFCLIDEVLLFGEIKVLIETCIKIRKGFWRDAVGSAILFGNDFTRID